MHNPLRLALALLLMLLLALVAAGCALPTEARQPTPVVNAATERALQRESDLIALEATVVMATVISMQQGHPAAPAVATETVNRYIDNVGRVEAMAPTLAALERPLQPLSRQPADATEAALIGTAFTASARVMAGTPTPWVQGTVTYPTSVPVLPTFAPTATVARP